MSKHYKTEMHILVKVIGAIYSKITRRLFIINAFNRDSCMYVCMYVCILHLLRTNMSCKWGGKSFICMNRRCGGRAADYIQKAV